MNMPTWREWLFSAKALIAALLALYIALAIPLENPYWAMASVYVVSHPLSGATRSKAIYRALGTLLGAAASVVLLPTFAQQPVMLSLAISLSFSHCWTARHAATSFYSPPIRCR